MAVAFVAEGGAASGTGGTSASFGITPSGTDRVLYVAVTCYGASGADPTGVTFDGTGLTKIQARLQWYDASSSFTVWRLINPAAVTANVVVTFAGTVDEYSVCAVVYSGVDQTTPNRTLASDDPGNVASTVTVTPTSVSGDTVVGCVSYNASGAISGGGTSRSSHLHSGNDGTEITEQTATGTSTTFTYNLGSSQRGVAAAAFALIAAASVTPTVPIVNLQPYIPA